MFKFLFVIFFLFILLVFLMGFSILRTFKNIFFGSGSGKTREEPHRQARHTSSSSAGPSYHEQKETYRSSSRRKKIFGKDEGEYVDYEEVK